VRTSRSLARLDVIVSIVRLTSILFVYIVIPSTKQTASIKGLEQHADNTSGSHLHSHSNSLPTHEASTHDFVISMQEWVNNSLPEAMEALLEDTLSSSRTQQYETECSNLIAFVGHNDVWDEHRS
jgi:hypothetical protein